MISFGVKYATFDKFCPCKEKVVERKLLDDDLPREYIEYYISCEICNYICCMSNGYIYGVNTKVNGYDVWTYPTGTLIINVVTMQRVFIKYCLIRLPIDLTTVSKFIGDRVERLLPLV